MKSSFSLGTKFRRVLWVILALLLSSRLVSIAVIPLTDTTESRYGEIARKMLETANWITPQYDYGVPFWGKPPLSTWLSAISMKLLGVNEFAARLPEVLLSLGVLWFVWLLAKERHNREFSLLSVALLASLPLFFVAGGAVMTDASLAFSTGLSFAAFWLAMTATDKPKQILWGYLFFVGQGLGLLAKGPICGVLTLFPIFFWMLPRGRRQWQLVWQRLPWISGSLLMLAIAAPWYYLAETRTPGFLNYFIVGEHFKRFTETGWQGDKYGHPHKVKTGTIWLYWLAGAFPWSLIAVGWLVRHFRGLRRLFHDRDGWTLYLLCWALWPMLFFTLSHNVLWTYTLTGLPAFALLVAELWHRGSQQAPAETGLAHRPWAWMLFCLPALTAIIASLLMIAPPASLQKATQKSVAQRYLELRPSANSQLYYLFTRFYSAEFYTGGRAHYAADLNEVDQLLTNNSRDFLAVKEGAVGRVPQQLLQNFRKVETIGGVLLLEENGSHAPQGKLGE
ncbi:MAG: glycosyltransferase family 39 protein [Chloroflexi bacterium]|nr:glycosyltransferase family 39 protein [Chloroflexota bacterium]